MKNYEKFFMSDMYACLVFLSLPFASFASLWLWLALVVTYFVSEICEHKARKNDEKSS